MDGLVGKSISNMVPYFGPFIVTKYVEIKKLFYYDSVLHIRSLYFKINI